MGKGRIVSGGTDGSYTIELLHNRERVDAEIEAMNAHITALEEELTPLETEREELVAERNAIASEIDQAVAEYQAAEDPEPLDVDALLVELSQVSAQIQQIDVRIAMLKVQILQASQRRKMLQAIPANPTQQAWCADFTEDLTGDVATVEVPAEGVVGQFATWRRVQIRPGYEGRASYVASRDGQMFHREGQEGYQAYFNAAILPGVQRWRPQYRIGVISNINSSNDTCTVQIQGEDSSAQALLIDPPNLQYTLGGVPIDYMDCNAEAFEDGDRVLVEFQGRDWSQPKVIGFESNPRECEPRFDISIAYRSRIFPQWVSDWSEPCDAGRDPCGDGLNPGVGKATGWGSSERILTRNGFETSDGNTSNNPDTLVEAFTVTGLTEADAVVAGSVTQYTRWITAELAGSVVETFEEAPGVFKQVYDSLLVTGRSPTVTGYDFRCPPHACTINTYRTIWTRTFSATEQPVLHLFGKTWQVIGWIRVDNEENDQAGFGNTLVFLARAIMVEIPPE